MVHVAVNQKPKSAGKHGRCPANSLISSMSHKDWKRTALIKPPQCITALQRVSRSLKSLSIPTFYNTSIGFVQFQAAWNEICSAMAELSQPAFFSKHMTNSPRKAVHPVQEKCPADSLISAHSHRDRRRAAKTALTPLAGDASTIQKFAQEVEIIWNEICSRFSDLVVPSVYSDQINTSSPKPPGHTAQGAGKCRADSLISSTSFKMLKNTALIEQQQFSTAIERVRRTMKGVNLYSKARGLANYSSNVVTNFCSSITEATLPTFFDNAQPYLLWCGKNDKKVSSHKSPVNGMTCTPTPIKKVVDHHPVKPTPPPSLNLANRVSAVAVAMTAAAKQVVAYAPTSQHHTQASKMPATSKNKATQESKEVPELPAKAKLFPNILNEQVYILGEKAANLCRWGLSALQDTTALIETGVHQLETSILKLSDQINPTQLESNTCRNKLAPSYIFQSRPFSTTCDSSSSSLEWANTKLVETWEEGKRGLRKRGKAVRKGVRVVLEKFRAGWVDGLERVV
ncbi:hypothetical protein BC830DRAFT_363325 [Chytriomyces sp. MP71]|nr:hypothetical protein BC830DRAFT_363325 [Chytriomyces sp. MP71]